MEKNKEVWALQLIKYFTLQMGFYRVNVINRPNGPAASEEYWLISESGKYDLIHIHALTDIERKATYPINVATCQKIRGLIPRQEKGIMLDISLNTTATDYSVEGIDYVEMHPGKVVENLEKEFPAISTVIVDVDNSDKFIKKIEKEITVASIKKSKQRGSLTNHFSDGSSITFKVIAPICIAVWACVNIFALIFKTDTINTAIFLGAYYKAFVTILNQWWRILSSGFVHISIFHLVCNLFGLYSLSKAVEKEMGFVKTLLVLIVSIMAGSLCEYVAGPNIVTVGLSGGIYGLFGAYTILCIQKGYFSNKIFIRSYMSTVYVNIIISLMPNVSAIAHFGGLVVGCFVTILLTKQFDKLLKISCAVCMIVVCLSGAVLAKNNYDFLDFYYGTDLEVSKIAEGFGLDSYAKKIKNNTYKYYLEREAVYYEKGS